MPGPGRRAEREVANQMSQTKRAELLDRWEKAYPHYAEFIDFLTKYQPKEVPSWFRFPWKFILHAMDDIRLLHRTSVKGDKPF